MYIKNLVLSHENGPTFIYYIFVKTIFVRKNKLIERQRSQKKQRCKIYAPSYHIFVLGESGEESNLFFEAWKGRDCGESVIIIFKSTSFQKTFLWRSVLGRLYQGLIFFEWILNVERGIFLLTEDLQYFYSFTLSTIPQNAEYGPTLRTTKLTLCFPEPEGGHLLKILCSNF